MRLVSQTGVVALLVLLSCTQSIGRPESAPVTLPLSETMLMRATEGGRLYRIFVALPESYRPNGGPYPVLYAADANAEFLTLVEAVRLAAFGGEIPPMIVVGIGYDLPTGSVAELMGPRMLDLTPTVDTAWQRREATRARADGYWPPEGSGGAAAFLRFIRSDLVPTIERKYPASTTDRGWFGHSAGGLFGVYALLNNENLFQRFLLGSPSLGWDRRTMFAAESTYAAAHRSLRARVFLAAGGDESAGMLTNLRTFASLLDQRRYEGLEYTLHVFEGEGHDAVIPATVSRGVRYLYKPSAP